MRLDMAMHNLQLLSSPFFAVTDRKGMPSTVLVCHNVWISENPCRPMTVTGWALEKPSFAAQVAAKTCGLVVWHLPQPEACQGLACLLLAE